MSRARQIALVLLQLQIAAGWAMSLVGVWRGGPVPDQAAWIALVAFGALGLLLALIWRPDWTRRAGESLLLVGLPAWGFAINHGLDACDACSTDHRLLAEPWIYALYAVYGLSVLAWVVSRRRPTPRPPGMELWINAWLLAGVIFLWPLMGQFSLLPALALVLQPVGLPLVAPVGVVALYLWELRARLRRLGGGAKATLLGAAPLSLGLLGLIALIQAVFFRDPLAAIRVYTETCSGTFHQLTPPDVDCHYLCTVAAQGHPRLVRPQRLGRRRGRIIVVNRQLSIANAFEDLLHERWPRLGSTARRAYDRVGLPISRHLRSRWVADAVYLAMKPAEWAFYLFLLLLDPGEPERRLDRMYRL